MHLSALPQVPFAATGVEWNVYRNELRKAVERSVVSMAEYQVLSKESFNEELFPELSTRIGADARADARADAACGADVSQGHREGELGSIEHCLDEPHQERRRGGDDRFIPLRGHRIRLSGPRLREASVLVVQLYPSLTASDVMTVLARSGFEVTGRRPVEVLRKALHRETEGVHRRLPTMTLVIDQYVFIEGSLSVRTSQRWQHRFPTLTQGARRTAAERIR
jgi:hypothetical protein